jgi:diacylglycerol kinase family enzyme
MDEVSYKTATEVDVTSETACPIEGDGEIFGWLPAKVKLITKQLDFLI